MIRNLYAATSPVLTLSTLLGTIFFVLSKKEQKYYLKSVLSLKIIAVTYVLIYTFSIAYLIITPLKQNNIGNHISTAMSYIGLLFKIIGHVVCTYSIYTFNFMQNSNIKNSLEEIAVVDENIKRLGHKMDYKSYVKYQIVGLFFGTISILFVITEQYTYIEKSEMFSITYYFCVVFYFPMILIFSVETQFATFTFLIYDRLKLINKEMYDISTFKGTVWKSAYNKISPNNVGLILHLNDYVTNQSIKKIEIIMKLHSSLNDIANHINNNYNLQILPIIASQFVSVVFCIFYAYYSVVIVNQKLVALQWTIWALLTCTEILLITVPCHFATKESKATGVYVHKILMNSLETHIREKLFVFSQQVHQCPMHFTACGLFNIDATLLFTIGGSAATYLLIMLQFQEGNDTNCVTKIISNVTH